jgi:hypothetical protein
MSLVIRNNKKLQAANKRPQDELAEMEEQLGFRMRETDHAMMTLDEEPAAELKAQAELARVKAELERERVKTNVLTHRLKCSRSEHAQVRSKYEKLKISFRDSWKNIDRLPKSAGSAQPSA